MALNEHLPCESEDSFGGDLLCVSVRSELPRAFRAHA